MRLFIGIPLGGPVRSRVDAAIAHVKADLGPAAHDWTFIRPASVHVTLKFLGEVEEARASELAQAMRRACGGVAAFDLGLHALGVFPSPDHPRVLWMGIGEGAEETVRLAEGMEREFEPLGFPQERRPFSPHVTLGRVKKHRRASPVGELLKQRASLEIVPTRVAHVTLVRSELSSHGSVYTPVSEVVLKG